MSPRKKSVTLKDVAKYAGVSPRTVSNVVNNWPYISDGVRAKVQEAISVLGYRPNQMARSLITGQTKTIGVMIPDIINPFFNLPVRGCEDILYQHHYNHFLCSTSEDVEREKYHLNLLISRAVDGLILWSTQIPRAELAVMIGENFPLVTIGFEGEPLGDHHTVVNLDDIAGSEQATRHLIEQGYRRIGHLTTFARNAVGERRLRGYQQALEAAGIPFDPRFVKADKASLHGGYRTTLELLALHKLDAIFCHNDLMALGAMFAARHIGREVPADLGIVGFDDIAMASIATPSLTTIRVAQYELGKYLGECILQHLGRETGVQSHTPLTFPVELQVRGSTNAQYSSPEHHQHLVEELMVMLSVELP
jgi:LacI family transcriptional regulator